MDGNLRGSLASYLDLIKNKRSNEPGDTDMAAELSRRRVLSAGGGALVAGSTLLTSLAARAQVQTLRIGHVLAPAHPFHLGLELASRKLAESTNGRLKLQVFPSSQLGTERDMNIALRTGGVDMLLAS